MPTNAEKSLRSVHESAPSSKDLWFPWFPVKDGGHQTRKVSLQKPCMWKNQKCKTKKKCGEGCIYMKVFGQ